MNYNEAREHILEILSIANFDVTSHLKIPKAKCLNTGNYFWFKTQAIYKSSQSSFSGANSLHVDIKVIASLDGSEIIKFFNQETFFN